MRAAQPAFPRISPGHLRGAAAFATAIAALCALPPFAGAAVRPKTGHYVGTSSTNVAGGKPLAFELDVARSKCAAPGARAKHKAYCVTVAPVSLIQTPCPATEFVDDEFFPATEPIALSAKGTISHTYPLYAGAGGVSDSPAGGGSKDGSFQFALAVDNRGNATGSARLQANFGEGECDSGVVAIAAKLKRK